MGQPGTLQKRDFPLQKALPKLQGKVISSRDDEAVSSKGCAVLGTGNQSCLGFGGGFPGRLGSPGSPLAELGLRAGLEQLGGAAPSAQGSSASLLGRYLNSLGSPSTRVLSGKGLLLKVMLCFSLSHRVLSVGVLDSKTTSNFY